MRVNPNAIKAQQQPSKETKQTPCAVCNFHVSFDWSLLRGAKSCFRRERDEGHECCLAFLKMLLEQIFLYSTIVWAFYMASEFCLVVRVNPKAINLEKRQSNHNAWYVSFMFSLMLRGAESCFRREWDEGHECCLAFSKMLLEHIFSYHTLVQAFFASSEYLLMKADIALAFMSLESLYSKNDEWSSLWEIQTLLENFGSDYYSYSQWELQNSSSDSTHGSELIFWLVIGNSMNILRSYEKRKLTHLFCFLLHALCVSSKIPWHQTIRVHFDLHRTGRYPEQKWLLATVLLRTWCSAQWINVQWWFRWWWRCLQHLLQQDWCWKSCSPCHLCRS